MIRGGGRPHEPHRRPLRRAEARRPRRADPVHRGLGSRCRHLDGTAARHAGRRRRPDRDRHAVHRSDGRRSDRPGRRQARAEGRREGQACADHGARVPPRGRRDADHPDGLPEPRPVLWHRALLRRCGGGRRRWADHGRPPDRGGRHAGAAGHRARHRHHPPGRADHRRRASAAGAEWQLRLRLLRQHHRHHRHAQHDGRASRRSDPAHPQGHRSADRRRLRRALAGAGGRGGARRRCGGGGIGAVQHDRGEPEQAGPGARCSTRCANSPPACAARGCTA